MVAITETRSIGTPKISAATNAPRAESTPTPSMTTRSATSTAATLISTLRVRRSDAIRAFLTDCAGLTAITGATGTGGAA